MCAFMQIICSRRTTHRRRSCATTTSMAAHMNTACCYVSRACHDPRFTYDRCDTHMMTYPELLMQAMTDVVTSAHAARPRCRRRARDGTNSCNCRLRELLAMASDRA